MCSNFYTDVNHILFTELCVHYTYVPKSCVLAQHFHLGHIKADKVDNIHVQQAAWTIVQAMSIAQLQVALAPPPQITAPPPTVVTHTVPLASTKKPKTKTIICFLFLCTGTYVV